MITLQFKDVSEVNAVLVALGKFPYEQVVNLINSIQAQAKQQLEPSAPAARKRIRPA